MGRHEEPGGGHGELSVGRGVQFDEYDNDEIVGDGGCEDMRTMRMTD